MPSLFLVVGLGQTGQSIARWLERKAQPYVILDTRPSSTALLQTALGLNAQSVFFERLPEAVWPTISEVICSPGIALSEPNVSRARLLNLPVYGDIECLCQDIQAPIVAITGTNGKSTVTSLVGEITKAHGYLSAVAGNIGAPVLDSLNDGNDYNLWVLELSSYQLEYTKNLSPRAATLLNISPDHLDRHETLENYRNAKQTIYQHCAYAIYNRDDAATKPKLHRSHAQLLSFGLSLPEDAHDFGLLTCNNECYLAQGSVPFLNVKSLKIQGRHNWLNALAASALAHQLDISLETIATVLENYRGLVHRSEWLRNVGGIDWINDSKGTNIGATIAALNGIGPAIKGKVILLVGGVGKGSDYTALIPSVTAYVRLIITFGQDKDKITSALRTAAPCCDAKDLNEATALAQKNAVNGDTVLLSPACASFDMFKDFNHRGEVFRQLVNAL